MKKIIKFVIPLFNDWRSLEKLLININELVKGRNFVFDFIIINDFSTEKFEGFKKQMENFRSIEIFNRKINTGHQACIAFGLRYASKTDFDKIIIMDSDGEDRPEEVINFLDKIEKGENKSIVAKRVKRSEGIIFKILYNIHKIITLIFTGKLINFGNFTCLNNQDVKKILNEKTVWSSFSGTVKKNIDHLDYFDSSRGQRYFGPSKMSLYNLCIHSLSIIAVFKISVFTRAILFAVIIFLLKNLIGSLLFNISMFLLVIFVVLIYLISFRENIKDFLDSGNNVDSIKNYTH